MEGSRKDGEAGRRRARARRAAAVGRTEAGKNERHGRSTASLVDSLDQRLADGEAVLSAVFDLLCGASVDGGEHRLEFGHGGSEREREREGEGEQVRGERGQRRWSSLSSRGSMAAWRQCRCGGDDGSELDSGSVATGEKKTTFCKKPPALPFPLFLFL